MASLAALKSKSQTARYSPDTSFRSIRSQQANRSEKLHKKSGLPRVCAAQMNVTVSLDSDIISQLDTANGDYATEIRTILRKHFRSGV